MSILFLPEDAFRLTPSFCLTLSFHPPFKRVTIIVQQHLLKPQHPIRPAPEKVAEMQLMGGHWPHDIGTHSSTSAVAKKGKDLPQLQTFLLHTEA